MANPPIYSNGKTTSAQAGVAIYDEGDGNVSTIVIALTDDDTDATTLPQTRQSLYLVSRTGSETSTITSTIVLPSIWAGTFVESAQRDDRNTGWRIRVIFTGGSTNLAVQFDDDSTALLPAGKELEIIYAPFVPAGLVRGSTTQLPIGNFILIFRD